MTLNAAQAVDRAEPNRLFQALDLHWRPPESGGLRYKSRQLKKTRCPPSRSPQIRIDMTLNAALAVHTMDYNPLFKSQLAQRRMTFRPFLIMLHADASCRFGST
jgi:hypothetical protein